MFLELCYLRVLKNEKIIEHVCSFLINRKHYFKLYFPNIGCMFWNLNFYCSRSSAHYELHLRAYTYRHETEFWWYIEQEKTLRECFWSNILKNIVIFFTCFQELCIWRTSSQINGWRRKLTLAVLWLSLCTNKTRRWSEMLLSMLWWCHLKLSGKSI